MLISALEATTAAKPPRFVWVVPLLIGLAVAVAGFDLLTGRFGGWMGRFAERCRQARTAGPATRWDAIANRVIGVGWCAFGVFIVLFSIVAIFGHDPR